MGWKHRLEDLFFLKKQAPYLWIIAIALAFYAKTIFFGYTYMDDDRLIINNYPFLSNLSNILQAFKQCVYQVGPSYRPLLAISLIIDAHIGGSSAHIYHFTNIIIHIISACLVYRLMLKLRHSSQTAFFLSVIYTIHPVLTQAVAWIPGRNDSLLALFVLTSFISFLNFLETKRQKWHAIHIVAFILALLTKESAIMLIPICIIYLHLIAKERMLSLVERSLVISWAGVLIPWSLVYTAVIHNSTRVSMSIADMLKAIYVSLPVIIQTIGKIVLPLNLSVLPTLQDTSSVFGFVSLAIGLIFFGLYRKGMRINFVMFGALWFLLFLIPSFIRPVYLTLYFLEHRVYLPIVGVIIMLSECYIIKNMNLRNRKAVAVSVAVIAALGIVTLNHVNDFRNELIFWRSAARSSPRDLLAHFNCGMACYVNGHREEAKLEFGMAENYIKANKLNIYSIAGSTYLNKHMLDEAKGEFQKGIENDSYNDMTYCMLGMIDFAKGNLKEAEASWKRALEINKDNKIAQGCIDNYLKKGQR